MTRMNEAYRPNHVSLQARDCRWAVYRIDDNGNQFVVRTQFSEGEAGQVVREFEARGHTQVYWAEQERA